MIDASTLVIPGPITVFRPTFPQVPAGCMTYAFVLNHRCNRALVARQLHLLARGVRTVLAAAGVRPVGADGHGSRKSARDGDDRADLPAAEHRAADAVCRDTACLRRTAARRGPTRRTDGARRRSTAPLASRQKLSCGNSVSPLSVRMPLPLSVDLESV